MSKFCPTCGNQLADDARFCGNCGSVLENAAPAPNPAATPRYDRAPDMQYNPAPIPQYGKTPQYGPTQAPAYAQYGAPVQPAPEKTNFFKKVLQFIAAKKLFFIIGGAALIVIIAVIIVLTSLSGSGPEGAFNQYANATKRIDVAAAADVDYNINFDKDTTKEEYLKEYNDMIAMAKLDHDNYNKTLQKASKLEYRLLGVVDYTDEQMKDELNYLKDNYNDVAAIRDVKEVYYEVVYYDDSNEKQSSTYTATALNVNGKWYLYDFNSPSVF